MLYQAASFVEFNVFNSEKFCLRWSRDLHVFTRSHGEKEGTDE
jgi:hypothetical protein